MLEIKNILIAKGNARKRAISRLNEVSAHLHFV